ncbi:hypothetical protein SCHPADRAFT_843478, partial [Schizopora paradoxa]
TVNVDDDERPTSSAHRKSVLYSLGPIQQCYSSYFCASPSCSSHTFLKTWRNRHRAVHVVASAINRGIRIGWAVFWRILAARWPPIFSVLFNRFPALEIRAPLLVVSSPVLSSSNTENTPLSVWIRELLVKSISHSLPHRTSRCHHFYSSLIRLQSQRTDEAVLRVDFRPFYPFALVGRPSTSACSRLKLESCPQSSSSAVYLVFI